MKPDEQQLHLPLLSFITSRVPSQSTPLQMAICCCCWFALWCLFYIRTVWLVLHFRRICRYTCESVCIEEAYRNCQSFYYTNRYCSPSLSLGTHLKWKAVFLSIYQPPSWMDGRNAFHVCNLWAHPRDVVSNLNSFISQNRLISRSLHPIPAIIHRGRKTMSNWEFTSIPSAGFIGWRKCWTN